MKKTISLLLSLAILTCIISCFGFSAYAVTGSDGLSEYELLSDGTIELTNYPSADEMFVPSEIDGYTVSKIGSDAFAGGKMMKITIPGTVKEISEHAFENCGLSTVVLQDGVEAIGSYAFSECATDLKINIPKSVTKIEDYAVGFDYNESGKPSKTNAVIVGMSGSAAEDYAANNGLEFISADENSYDFEYTVLDDGTIEITAYLGNAVNLTIPSKIDGYTVSSIGSMAIFDNDTIESITVPGTVKTLTNQAIDSCDSLKQVILEEGVESLLWIAIVDCPALEKVVIPQSVTFIDEYAIGYGISSKGGTEEKVGNPVIYGYENSAAQKYAAEYGISFALINNAIDYDKSNLKYVIGSNQDATIYCIYELSDLVNVEMDGNIIDPSNYTLAEGSTILTFKPEYLDTLSPGDHTVTMNYNDDSVSVILTIEKRTIERTDTSKQMQSPDTGASYIGIAVATGSVILASSALIILKKKAVDLY